MFGPRRRRPLLGAAIVAGTATVAARHSARSQVQAEADRQFQAQQAAEYKRLEEERDEARTQRAIEQGVDEALARQQQQQIDNYGQGPVTQRSVTPSYNQYPADAPTAYRGVDPYAAPGRGQSPYLQPQSAEGLGRPPPQYTGAVETETCFCSACGARGSVQHKFCASCGRPMGRSVPECQEGFEKLPIIAISEVCRDSTVPCRTSGERVAPPGAAPPPKDLRVFVCLDADAPARKHIGFAICTHIASKTGIELYRLPQAFAVNSGWAADVAK